MDNIDNLNFYRGYPDLVMHMLSLKNPVPGTCWAFLDVYDKKALDRLNSDYKPCVGNLKWCTKCIAKMLRFCDTQTFSKDNLIEWSKEKQTHK